MKQLLSLSLSVCMHNINFKVQKPYTDTTATAGCNLTKSLAVHMCGLGNPSREIKIELGVFERI